MRKLLLILFSFLSGSGLLCQQDQLFYDKVDALLKLFDESNYTPVTFDDTSLAVIDRISKSRRPNNYSDRSLYLDKQQELLRRDPGLSAFGTYLENANPTIGDLEENLNYTRRFQAGVEWQVFKGGFFENRVKARILEDRLLRERLQNDAQRESGHYLQRFDETIYLFNKVKVNLLNQRKGQLQKQYALIRELVLLKKLKKEEMINMETRLAEVESLIDVYKSYNDYLSISIDSMEFDMQNLPLIDLDYDKLFNLIELQTDSILGQHSYTDYYKWYHNLGVRPYFRYNYYVLYNSGYRSFFSTGVNLTVPIPFNTRLQNEVQNEKWKFDNDRLVNDRLNLHEDILNTGYEFRYKLKQFIGFYQKRQMFMERLRVEKVKVRLNDANIDPMQGLELYDDLLRIDLELVDLLQNLYLKALKVHSRIPNSEIRDIIKNQAMHEVNDYVDKKKRAVYVWSKTFTEYSPEFLAEYAIYNEFDKAIVAVMKNDTIPERERFMQYAAENGEVHFMLGNNKLFYEENIEGYIQEMLDQYPAVKPDGIHLDIEPHTFEDWGSRKQELLNQYLELVGKVSTFCKGKELQLSVSIPPHYNKEVIDKLLQLCDQVYFMCYENVDTDYLFRKIVPFLDNAQEKITLAFRTEDFENRIELEEKLNELETKTQIHLYAYHDLRRMIEFDRKSIE